MSVQPSIDVALGPVDTGHDADWVHIGNGKTGVAYCGESGLVADGSIVGGALVGGRYCPDCARIYFARFGSRP